MSLPNPIQAVADKHSLATYFPFEGDATQTELMPKPNLSVTSGCARYAGDTPPLLISQFRGIENQWTVWADSGVLES
jgi:hypothetical protein